MREGGNRAPLGLGCFEASKLIFLGYTNKEDKAPYIESYSIPKNAPDALDRKQKAVQDFLHPPTNEASIETQRP